MPRFMLDTNMCIYLMRDQPEQVARRFAQCYVGDVVMSAITYAELEYGVAVSADPARERLHLASLVEDIPVMPFEAAAALGLRPRPAGDARAQEGPSGQLRSQPMRWHWTCIPITNNERDFAHYPGLRLENWLQG